MKNHVSILIIIVIFQEKKEECIIEKKKRTRIKIPFIVLLFGLFAISLNTNLMKVALPFFMDKFQIDTTRLIWITITYTFFQALLTPLFGKLGDAWEHNKIILGGYIIFMVGSIAGGAATSFYGILIGRSIQGMGAAAVLPNTLISAPSMFPIEKKSWAIGLLISTVASAAFIGPAVGGLLMEVAGWRSLFFINIPITLIVFFTFFLYAKKREHVTFRLSVFKGIQQVISISIIFGYWVIMLNMGIHYGWTSILFLILMGIFLVLVVLFYVQEKNNENNFNYIDLFLNKQLRAGVFCGALRFVVIYGTSFILPLLMAIEYNMSPGKIGLFLALANVSRFFVAPISGIFSDRHGRALPVKIGFISFLLALFILLSFIRAQFNELLYLSIVLIGAGSGFISASALSAVQDNSPDDSQGAMMGLYSSIRFIAGMTGQVIIGLLLQPLENNMHIEQSSPIFDRAFGFIIIIVILGYLFSRALPGSRAIPKNC